MAAALDYRRVRDFLARLPIKDQRKQIVPFQLKPGQNRFVEFLIELQDRHRLPRVMVVKSRRVGISAICTGILVAHCVHMEHADARITAHRTETAHELHDNAVLMHGGLELDVPLHTRQQLRFGWGRSPSKLTVGTAKNVPGGRGMGFSALLSTEAAYYEQEGSFMSLMPTAPLNPNFPVFFETTANGRSGIGEVFYNQWLAAVEGRSEFGAFFLGPQEDPECVVDELTTQRVMALPCDKDNTREERDLVQRFGLTPPQLAWRRIKLADDCQGDLRKLRQEFPYYWEQAFVASGYPLFEDSELTWAEETVKSAGTGRRVMLDAEGHPHGRKIVVSSRSGPFTVFKPPVEGHSYYIGGDAAKGLETGDFTAGVVLDGTAMEVVCTFAEKIPVAQAADLWDRLGRWYGRHMPTGQALFIIEHTGGYGNTIWQLMRDSYHYSNFYWWKGKDDRLRFHGTRSAAVGWETTQRTREMMTGHFRVALQKHELKLADERLMSQLRLATVKESLRWDVAHGHDDLMIAVMLAWMARKQWPPLSMDVTRVAGPDVVTPEQAASFAKDSFETLADLGSQLLVHQEKVLRPPHKPAAAYWQEQSQRRPRL